VLGGRVLAEPAQPGVAASALARDRI
jgi:hypothetical protein